jgi:hypothetical protein
MGRLVARAGGGRVESAYSAEEGRKMIASGNYPLVLVNRIIDGDGSSGVEFIREMKDAGVQTTMMLVSDYASAQEAAVAAGAVLGFGKSAMDGDDVLQRVREGLGV